MVDTEWFKLNIQKCKEILGEEKIYSSLKKYDLARQSKVTSLQRREPLLFTVFLADKQISESPGRPDLPMTNEIITLSNLGNNLTILMENSIDGLTDKINELFTEKFEKIAYEISIASLFVRKDFDLKFIPESDQKRPDILILLNDGIEVECKKKDDLTPRDHRIEAFYNLFRVRVTSQMDHWKKNVVIVLETEDDPKPSDLPSILKKSNEIIEMIDTDKIIFENSIFNMICAQTEPYDKIISSPSFNISECYRKCGIEDIIKELDWKRVDIDFTKLDNGTIQQKNPRLIGCKSNVIPDRIIGISKLIEKAKYQLSGTKSGIIFIDHNIFDRDIAETDLTRIDPLIKKCLLNNSKISAVVLTQAQIFHEPIGTIYWRKGYPFINSNPKYELPLDIKLIMNSF